MAINFYFLPLALCDLFSFNGMMLLSALFLTILTTFTQLLHHSSCRWFALWTWFSVNYPPLAFYVHAPQIQLFWVLLISHYFTLD